MDEKVEVLGDILDKKVNYNSLESNYIKACSDPKFIKLVNELEVSEKVKQKYTSHLKDCAEIMDTCSNCKGIKNCPYNLKGVYEHPIVKDNQIEFVVSKCKYKIKLDKETEYLKNIYSFKMTKDIETASFKNVYRDDSNRLETIKKIKEFYDNYIKGNRTKGLYLNGNFGCGKTYLIAALFNELAKKGYKSCIVYYPELLESLKNGFKNYNESDNFENLMDRVKNSPLLLLDDIGAEKLTEWNRDEILGVILQYRMQEHLPTFFTSNLNLKELSTHLSTSKEKIDSVKAERIIERIKNLSSEITMISVNRRN